MIPPFLRDGNLPPGQHKATWPEIAQRFGGNGRRDRLVEGLSRMLLDLARAGCRLCYLDGSFVSREKWPSDFDLCFDPHGMDSALLPPELLDVSARRARQKSAYFGEGLSCAMLFDWEGLLLLEMFQLDKERETPKGVLLLRLDEEETQAIRAWREEQGLPGHPRQPAKANDLQGETS